MVLSFSDLLHQDCGRPVPLFSNEHRAHKALSMGAEPFAKSSQILRRLRDLSLR